MKTPPPLKPGDTVRIVCPSWRIDEPIDDAVRLLERWGLTVQLGKSVHLKHNQYAGTDAERAADLQHAIDDPEVKAIFAARGGYGAMRIVDRMDFRVLTEQPKWLIGFSDITVLHSHIHRNLAIESIHGQMPLNVKEGSSRSLDSLRDALFGKAWNYRYESPEKGLNGTGIGQVIGGNLALLVNLLGSDSDMDYDGKILFIEDVGEYYYSVDRMLWALKRAGKLDTLAGLLVGGFTHMKESSVAFGHSLPDIIREVSQAGRYPVAFDFPAGHQPDNCALIFGRTACLEVREQSVNLGYV